MITPTIFDLLTKVKFCEVHRNRPRTFVADLAINPNTGQAEPIKIIPILTQEQDDSQVRENMKQLLDMIMGFFEDEIKKVEDGTLKEEDQVLANYVQEIDPSAKLNTRPIPAAFNHRRA